MAYAAFAEQREYRSPLSEKLGFASEDGASVALARGKAGEATLEENTYRIDARAAEERRQQELATARAAQRENALADGEAPKPADPQQTARLNGPAGVSPALRGPAPPANT